MKLTNPTVPLVRRQSSRGLDLSCSEASSWLLQNEIKPEERIKTTWDRHTPFLERPRLHGKLCKKSQASADTLQMQSHGIFISTKNDKAHSL
jgi:hypothetical protein